MSDETPQRPGFDWIGDNLSEAQLSYIRDKYKHATTEQGYYFDEEDRCWRPIEEYWQPVQKLN